MMKSSRLKNFCEICRKQCKDENGFHCHLNSASHQHRVRQFATNPEEHIQKYSKQLENRIVQMLKVKYPGEFKDVDQLYDQYTEDKYYIKFSHTQWKNLEQFVSYLAKNVKNIKVSGKAPHTKIMYTVSRANDFMLEKKQKSLLLRQQYEKQQTEKNVEKRLRRAKEIEGQLYQKMVQKIQKQREQQPVYEGDKLEIKFDTKVNENHKRNAIFDLEKLEEQAFQGQKRDKKIQMKKKKNADILLQQLEKQQKKKNPSKEEKLEEQQDDEPWIMENIIVKILPHEIPQAFHHKKVQIDKVQEQYVGRVRIGNAILSIDQTYFETVIPKVGHKVKVVRGSDRGKEGSLVGINIQSGTATILFEEGEKQLTFNSFSKYVSEK